jgi:hypothetical protein
LPESPSDLGIVIGLLAGFVTDAIVTAGRA